jgi:hypothetical protein
MSSILSVSALSHMLASSSSVLPAAQVGLRALGNRHSSILRGLTTSASTQKSTPAATKGGQPTHHDAWSFAPLARELARSAGGFEHRAHWPLSAASGCSLLDATLTSGRGADLSASFGLASYYHARHFSSAVPHSASSTSSSVAPTRQEHTAAIELPANDDPADLSAAAATATTRSWLSATWLARFIPKAQPRVKGMSRKLVLRQINRQIVSRVARRATIGACVVCWGLLGCRTATVAAW